MRSEGCDKGAVENKKEGDGKRIGSGGIFIKRSQRKNGVRLDKVIAKVQEMKRVMQ
jgi:hypothetical protein